MGGKIAKETKRIWKQGEHLINGGGGGGDHPPPPPPPPPPDPQIAKLQAEIQRQQAEQAKIRKRELETRAAAEKAAREQNAQLEQRHRQQIQDLQRQASQLSQQQNALQTQLDQARTAERLSQEKIAALLERVSHFEAELPRIEALRDAYKNEIEEFKKREEDPALLRENENRLFDTFVTSLEELNLNETAKQQAQESNEANVGLLAKVSAGKSMIANALNGGQVKVAQTGIGRTTTDPSIKYTTATDRGTKVNVWDVPGDDDQFAYFEPENIKLLSSLNVFVIVYDNSVEMAYRLIRVAYALGKPVILVRNKVDLVGADEASWESEIEKEKDMLSSALRIPNPVIFGISAKNTFENRQAVHAILRDPQDAAPVIQGGAEYEWHQFFTYLLGQCDAVVNATEDVPLRDQF